MKLKYFTLLIFLSLPLNMLAQKIEISPNNQYFAAYFQKVKDSVIFVEERGSFTEKLVRFAKYKICIYDAATGKELHQRETKIVQRSKKGANVKMQFDKNSELLYVAIENEEVLVFNTSKGFIAKYKAQDFCFNKDKSKVILLESKRIRFLNTEKQFKRSFQSFTEINYTADDKFIIVSRESKGKKYCVFIEVKDLKHNKTISGTKVKYNTEDQSITALKSTKISIYKSSNFKDNEKDLEKEFLNKEYKKNITLARFNSDGTFFVHQSSKYLSVLSSKGKAISRIEKPSGFVSYLWINNSEIKLILKEKISIYNIETESLSNEGSVKFNYPKNVAVYPISEELKNKFYSIKFAALNLKNGFLLKNTTTNQQVYIENESFLHFSENENYLFTKTNDQELNIYKAEDIFKKKRLIKLKSNELRMLSPIVKAYFYEKTEKQFYSSDLKTILTTYNETRVDTLYYQRYEAVNQTEVVDDKIKIDSTVVSEMAFIQGALLFNTDELNSKNYPISQNSFRYYEDNADSTVLNNPILLSRHKEQLRTRRYSQKSNLEIADVKITNKKTLIVRQKNKEYYKIIDIRKNKELIGLERGEVFFSPDNSFIIVKTDLKTILYNAISGKIISSNDAIYSDILLTNDTTFFIGMNKAGSFVFEGLQKSEDLNSSIVKMTKNGKFLLVVEKNKTKVKLYSLPELKEISSNSIDEKYKKFFYNPQIEVSENAKHFSCAYKKELLILSSQKANEKQIHLNNVSAEKSSFWINDEELIVTSEESNLVLNTKTEVFSKNLDFNFYFSESDLNSLNEKKIKAFASNNSQFSVLETTEKKFSDLYIKSTSEKYKHYFIPNAKFIAFDENDQRIYFSRGKSKISFVETSQLIANATDLKIHSIKAARTRTRNLPPRPSIFRYDSSVPEGYVYRRFIEANSIEELKGKIGMYAFNLISKGNSVNLNLHLLDEKGVFYTSSDKEKNKDIWCELWIKYPDGKVKKIENFDVLEQNADSDDKSTNYALSMVLDHSGSMGSIRCQYQQKGVKAFIEKKRDNDAVSVVKFDHKVETEILLKSSKTTLLSELVIDGSKRFGGSTALYDGIYDGITEVAKEKGKRKKAVIVITDGYENSSYTYLNELILYALENKVQIHTVGFGAFVNKPVLQTIAYQTGGSFYEIYNTNNFSWIFKDVFNKLSNHYTVNFATPQEGKYTVMLKSCTDIVENNLVLAFDNNEITYGKIKEYGQNGFGIPFIDLSDSITVDFFKSDKPIPNIDRIINKNGSNLDYYTEKEFRGIKFPDIKFVTDKTVIIKGTDKGLDDVILFMKKHPRLMIKISGHTDNVGGDKTNLLLSSNRAKKIKSIIVKAGVDKYRITTQGYGETKPIDTNETDEGRLKNRRVEFKIVK